MIRGTTPIHVFMVDYDLTEAEVIYVSYSQRNNVLIEKSIEDITIEPDRLIISMTQEETLRLDSSMCEIQIRAKMPDGLALASNIMTTVVKPILKGGEI